MTQVKPTKSTYFHKLSKQKDDSVKEFAAVIKNRPEKYPSVGDWKGVVYSVNKKCVGCQQCIKLCPEATITVKEIGDRLQAKIDPKFCKGCGICAEVCPVSAIESKKL